MPKTYQLVLHDFGNIACQVLQYTSEDCSKQSLVEIADKMNYLFAQAGKAKQFEAQVLEAD